MNEPKNDEPKYWTKHIDTRYISGEDLRDSVEGLSPEMGVYMYNAIEGETFDQNAQKKDIKWILHFKDIETNEPLYKGIVANVGTKDLFKLLVREKYKGLEFEDAEDKKSFFNDIRSAYNIPVTLYAKADKRHGHVVRFKNYNIPPHIKTELGKLSACKTLKELEEAYKSSEYKTNVIIKEETQKLKNTLK